jgi:hypothetical protein
LHDLLICMSRQSDILHYVDDVIFRWIQMLQDERNRSKKSNQYSATIFKMCDTRLQQLSDGVFFTPATSFFHVKFWAAVGGD